MVHRPVRQLIERSRLCAAAPDATVKTAVDLMAEHRCGSIVVIERGRVVGIFTECDLLMRVVHVDRDPHTTRLAEVMTPEPDTIDANAPVADAIRAMDEFCYHYLPVIENERCIGVISIQHLPFADVLGMQRELEKRHALAEHMW